MNRILRLAPLGLALAAATAQVKAQVPAIPGVPAAVQQAADSIDAEKIRAHVQLLADDLLEGRGPGKRGAEIAAKYIGAERREAAIFGRPPTDGQSWMIQGFVEALLPWSLGPASADPRAFLCAAPGGNRESWQKPAPPL